MRFVMDAEDWQALDEFPNHLAAEIVASVLRAQSVPVRITSSGALPGLEQGSTLLVPASLVHRAKWLLAQAQVSDAELEFLATGKLPLRR